MHSACCFMSCCSITQWYSWVPAEILSTSNWANWMYGWMADRPGFVVVWRRDFSAIAEKLQNTQSWNFACKCNSVCGRCPYIFYLTRYFHLTKSIVKQYISVSLCDLTVTPCLRNIDSPQNKCACPGQVDNGSPTDHWRHCPVKWLPSVVTVCNIYWHNCVLYIMST